MNEHNRGFGRRGRRDDPGLAERRTPQLVRHPQPLISLSNVKRAFLSGSGEHVTVLRQVNLNVARGEFVVIRGESGSGKTTLLKILGLLDQEFQGTYQIGGQTVNRKPVWWLDEMRSRNIGFVFQEGRLFEHLTVRENVALPFNLLHKRADRRQLPDLLKDFAPEFFTSDELERTCVLDIDSGIVSGGQRQRAAIWRAVICSPPIILADEPTASLDQARKHEVVQRLLAARKQGFTVIVVSHDKIFHKVGSQYLLSEGVLQPVEPVQGDDNSGSHADVVADACGEDGGDSVLSVRRVADESVQPVAKHDSGPNVLTEFSALRTWSGWRPRADLTTLSKQILRDTFYRPLFLSLILVALVAGVCQISVFASVIKGTQTVLDNAFSSGSRLTRVTVKPKSENRNKEVLFPAKRELRALPGVAHIVGRRDGLIRLITKSGQSTPLIAMGLHNDDPEYRLLHFVAGGSFSSETALEVIVKAETLPELLNTDGLASGAQTFDDFIRQEIEGELRVIRGEIKTKHSVRLKIVGIITHGEGDREIYLPNTTLRVFDKFRAWLKGSKPLPVNADRSEWTMEPEELVKFAEFPWQERLHVYASTLEAVIPLIEVLGKRGYRTNSDIWTFKWALDIRRIVWRIFTPLMILVVSVAALTISTNIFASAKIREKEFALLRILGMRAGDLAFSQVGAAVLIVIVGTGFGIGMAHLLTEWGREVLLSHQNLTGC